ncbi:MAG TPA: sterol desaturase family protein [Hyphomonadaceae bacterium]|nr:sterol desaturase family protein [Hyphomonadaceae bacterium]
MLDFLASRIEAWTVSMTSPRMLVAIAFLLLLLVWDIAKRGWKLSWSRRAIKGVFASVSIFHINLLFVPVVWAGSEYVKQGYAALGIPGIAVEAWAGWPLWVLAPLALIAYDFADYWTHRVLHIRSLWPIHAIHHSDPDVNGLTAYRIHFLEGLAMLVCYALLLTWIGLPPEAIGIGAFFRALYNIYVHIDVDWDHGPLHFVLASPRFHRWHHADDPQAYDKNLANVLPVWDVLFGTYRNLGKLDAPLGASGVPQHDIVRLTLWPFLEWAKLVKPRPQTEAAR